MSTIARAPQPVAWSEGTWTTPPPAAAERDGRLLVTAAEGSDAWRLTSYGFVHDSEHALLAPMPDGTAMEVEFDAAFEAQFDQAGLFVRVDDARWVKAGVEFSDGDLQLGAVVTDGMSDWSLAPVPEWLGRRITVRVSRSGNALTMRAGAAGDPLRLVRVIPFAAGLEAAAGPFVCAPTRAGLTVPFASWQRGPADAALH
ncbi:DUF1349 domain-containing protein [Microbacterium oleivorans]|uniref:DUF1349 domain-containing protein n=1 Tax=Microbacterium oleivorans TaxID=273677 RepID=UPI00203C805D|nr:DUF1349 domain-containing protein [Microbacterium oleivorans]MCM3695430.1 DUF1349 domain-containing protein [Microbacterium oleivorans]